MFCALRASVLRFKKGCLDSVCAREVEAMAKPLDGIALSTYIRRLKLSKETQERLIHIRSSPPSRTPEARKGNMPVWYPSKKMQCIIKAESAKVEFAFLLQTEHDDDVLEVWDQPPSIPLEYLDKRGRLQRPMHTADYFVFRYRECGWIECKPVEKLQQFAQQGSKRYVLDEKGQWRCPPGEAFAAKHGLTYQVWSSDQINWAVQDNTLYLEDYYQDLERLNIPETTLEILYRFVDEHPGITLADLRAAAHDVPADLINIAIARHALYVDLATYRLSEPWRTPVFRSRPLARASSQSRDQGNEMVTESKDRASRITSEGQALLDQASDVDLATALFRNRVINPDDYQDDEQVQAAPRIATVQARTKQRWQQRYREAETQYGSGFLGLLPGYHNCGGTRKIGTEVITLIHSVLETHYDTLTRKPKRGAYGEYLKRSEEQHLEPVSQRTFYTEAHCHKTVYEQIVVREGMRAAYPFKDYVHESEKTVSRHGEYAWAMAHLDHTELNLVLCDSRTGQSLGKCWLTLLILSHPRRIAAFYLTFDPPSYRSCMMALRLCVKRYGRLPTAITVDGGPEFHSVYFEQLLALYCVRKHQRPASEPRFGSPQERLFGTMETEFLYHLLGNTQATQQPRTMTKATDPERLAVWTLPKLAEQVQQWADEEYETIRHPALGMTPREAYELSMKRDGERVHKYIEYDDTFLKATFPTTRKGTAKVEPGVGVRMNYLDYWCEAMRDVTVENTQVKVRYDPFDVSSGYARIDGKWRECITPYTEFAGCSERELQLLTTELRQRNRLQYGRAQVELTQKQLATFRRENATIETVLSQQRHDRETKAALKVLEGGKATSGEVGTPLSAADAHPSSQSEAPDVSSVPAKLYGKLLVLKRIEL
jgi:putative transposase